APLDPARLTPTFYVPSKVTRYWGDPADIASDNPYADLDGDGIPELAIGRLTARTPAELQVMLNKILAYEDSRDFGPWRTRINFVAGEGGFGSVVDGLIETAAQRLITTLPATYEPTMTSACWRSNFCPGPSDFHSCCLNRLNEGCLFWVFMGHG